MEGDLQWSILSPRYVLSDSSIQYLFNWIVCLYVYCLIVCIWIGKMMRSVNLRTPSDTEWQCCVWEQDFSFWFLSFNFVFICSICGFNYICSSSSFVVDFCSLCWGSSIDSVVEVFLALDKLVIAYVMINALFIIFY